MANFLLLLAILCGGASYAFYTAACLAGLWILIKFTSALRG